MNEQEWLKEAERLTNLLINHAKLEASYAGGPLMPAYRGETQAAQYALLAHLQARPLPVGEVTPLTDEQIIDLAPAYYPDSVTFARLIEAAHGIAAPPSSAALPVGEVDSAGGKQHE